MTHPRIRTLMIAMALPLSLVLAQPTDAIVPQWLGQDYDADPQQVRTVLLAVFEKEGLELDEEADREQEDELVTSYQEFGQDDFGPDVARPTPPLSRTYPFLQKRRMGQGEYRVRARIRGQGSGSRLELLVEMLSPAFNRITYEHTKVDRVSNGVIEGYLHTRVVTRLSSGGAPQTAPSD